MSSTVLTEYLIALGFKVDEAGAKKTTSHMDRVNKVAGGLGRSVLGVQVAVTAMVSTFTYQMEKLYYASRRTGSAVGSIQALEFGAKQIGLSGDQMKGALEGMARSLRSNPGLTGLLNSLGVKVEGRDKSDVLVDMVTQLKKMPFFVAEKYANMFGIDSDTLFMLQDGLDKLKEAQVLRKQMAMDSGVDTEKAAEAAKQYANVLRELWERVGLLKDAISIALLPSFKEFAQVANLVVTDLIRTVNEFKGFSDFAQRIKEGLFGSSREPVKLATPDTLAKKEIADKAFLEGKAFAAKLRAMFGMAPAATNAAGMSQAAPSTPSLAASKLETAPTPAPVAKASAMSVDKQAAAAILEAVEKKYALPTGLLDKFWKQESGRGRNMVGPMTKYGERAMGHFQFMSGTAKQYGVADPMDLQDSANGAGKYISKLLRDYGGDLRKAAAAYNWGPGNVAKYGLGKAPKETRDYMDAVAGKAHITQTNNITVTGVSNPKEAADRALAGIDQSNADLVRNFAPKVE